MAIRLEGPKQYYATSSLVLGYALCSSLLAVINKFAITHFNYPGLLTSFQYLTSALGVWILGKLGLLHHDAFTWETAKKFLPAAFVFFLAIFTNTNLLRHANVDTFIVFRSCTPLLVALADTAFRKQPCPSKLTFLSLVIILGGAIGYVATDSAFTLTAYSWAIAYLVTITTEMVYIKHMVTNLGLNTWGFVLYNNLLSLMMAPLFLIITGEYADVFVSVGSGLENLFNPVAFFAVLLSCVFGLLISFFGFAARKAISATAFTVTGVVNKFLTVAINVIIWDKHASPFGLLCLLFTIAGGVFYQQSVTGAIIAPPKESKNKHDNNYADVDENEHLRTLQLFTLQHCNNGIFGMFLIQSVFGMDFIAFHLFSLIVMLGFSYLSFFPLFCFLASITFTFFMGNKLLVGNIIALLFMGGGHLISGCLK